MPNIQQKTNSKKNIPQSNACNQINKTKVKQKRRAWNGESELALLNMWSDRIKELRSTKKHGYVYAEIASELSKLGFKHSGRDVQVKIHNFTQRYRREKVILNASGGSSSTWSYYGWVNQMFGGFKTNNLYDMKLNTKNESSSLSPMQIICDPMSPSLSICASLSSPSPSSSPATPTPATPIPAFPLSVARESGQKIKNNDSQTSILENLEKLSHGILEHLQKSEQNEKELIQIEKEKLVCLKKFTKSNEELKNAIIKFLNKD